MRVYVETTVWSFAVATDSPDLTAQTVEFFAACEKGRFQAVIGPTVLDEIDRADETTRELLRSLIGRVSPSQVPTSDAGRHLASEFLRMGAVPPSKPDDASHVADAVLAGGDVLVSWNFKHIANKRREEKFNAIALLSGYRDRLMITTPSEVLYGDDAA